MTTMYVHQNKKNSLTKGTIAVDVPTKSDLEKLFTLHANQLLMNIGVTVKSPKDSFNRKKGREQAAKNRQPWPMDLKSIEMAGTKHVYNFNVTLKHKREYGPSDRMVRISLTTVAESDVVKVVFGDIL
jgi:hypothetical protein